MLHPLRSPAPTVRALGVPPHSCRISGHHIRSKAASTLSQGGLHTSLKVRTCKAFADPMLTAGGVRSIKQHGRSMKSIALDVDTSAGGALRGAQWLCTGCKPRPDIMVTQEWESARIQLQQVVEEVEGKRGRCVSDEQQGVKFVAIQCGEWLQQGQPGYEKMPHKLAALKPTGPARGIIRAYGVGGRGREHQRECMVLPLGEDGYPVADRETGAALLMPSAEFKACTTRSNVNNYNECFKVAHQGELTMSLETFFKHRFGFARVSQTRAAPAGTTSRGLRLHSSSSSSSSSNRRRSTANSNRPELGQSSSVSTRNSILQSEGASSLQAATNAAHPSVADLWLSQLAQEAYAAVCDSIKLTDSKIEEIEASISEVEKACLASTDDVGMHTGCEAEQVWDQLHKRRSSLMKGNIMRKKQLKKLLQKYIG